MSTLQKFFGVGVVVALLGLNAVMADVMKPDSATKPLEFSLDIGDGSVDLPAISFDAEGDEAQTTCAMTPGGVASNLVLQLPPVAVPKPEQWGNAPRTTSAPLDPLPQSQRNDPNNNRRRPMPTTPLLPTSPEQPPPPPILVPEPATLVIVGLGVGAVAVVRRRWKNR